MTLYDAWCSMAFGVFLLALPFPPVAFFAFVVLVGIVWDEKSQQVTDRIRLFAPDAAPDADDWWRERGPL